MKKVNSIKEIEEIIDKEKMTLLFFSDNMWSNCLGFGPKLKNLLKRYPKITSLEIDINKNIDLRGKYLIYVAPTIILFIHGKETIKLSKFISMDILEEKIKRYYNMIFDKK